MLTVQEINGWLSIKCAYSYKDRVKKLPGARFDYTNKVWMIPKKSLPDLMLYFRGEIYFKTPLWKIEGKPMPPKQELEFYDEKVKIPELNLRPYEHQIIGMQFCVDRLERFGFCLVGDQMGLGKSLIATGVMKWYKTNRRINKILIVCTKSLKYQWASELNRYTGWTNIHITGDTPKKRMKAYEDAEKGGILITNYHNFLRDSEVIGGIGFDLCIIDEAHNVKARDGKINNNIASVTQGRKTILMTGTPIMSKPDDIYGIVKLASGKYFGDYEDFEDNYLVIEHGIFGRQIIGAKNLDVLHKIVGNILIRRTTDDIREDLPKVMKPVKILAQMDNTQKKLAEYIESKKHLLDKEKEKYLGDVEARGIIEEINEMSKMYIAASQFIADDPAALRCGPKSRLKSTLAAMVPANYKMSNKTEATLDLVKSMLDAEEKVIIFCQYATTAFMLKDAIEKYLKVKVATYTGRENTQQRKESKDSFFGDTDVLIATSAAEAGLNLQIAGYIINYEQPETYASRGQRLGRIRRIDSKYSQVTEYDIITENSFDEIRYNKIMRDKDISEAIVG